MSCFASERQPGALAIELCSPVNELLNPLRPFFHQYARRFRIDDAVTGVDRVLEMEADLVFIAQGYRDPALRILRIRFRKLLLAQHQNTACFGQGDSCAQSSHTGADNNKINVFWKFLHESAIVTKAWDLEKLVRCSLRSLAVVSRANAFVSQFTTLPNYQITQFIYDACVKRIRVQLEHNPYDVKVGRGLLRQAGREILRALSSHTSRVFVVTSPNVRRHWGGALETSLLETGLEHEVLEMDDGEPHKRLETVERLAEQLVAAGADRKSLLVAFGGGVVGDCAGFLAAIFLRGIPVVQIPTTFLAQVDASIGGKTGVNLDAGKNLIGSFHQPKAVLVDPEVLSTLDDREFRAGLFESLKCGVIRDRSLFKFMSREALKVTGREAKALEKIISASIRVKAAVVAADEKESDLRRILNFGHTIGHALEAATGYKSLLHGEAVGWGMIAASQISAWSRFCTPETAEQITSAVKAYGPLPAVKIGAQEIVSRLSADKKTVGGVVHFVLPIKIGKVRIAADVPMELVSQAIEQIRNHA